MQLLKYEIITEVPNDKLTRLLRYCRNLIKHWGNEGDNKNKWNKHLKIKMHNNLGNINMEGRDNQR